MRPTDILELLRKCPFAPFRIHITDGRTYEIRHPDQLIVLRSRLVLGVAGDGGVPEHLEHLSFLHVVRVEELPSESAESAG